ncbi:MAG: DUF378 domain-containing protein [Parcubacteria group bacterium]|nr:DUF378 domain-containing protein [Parcubacteria group bacterium]
MMLNKVAWVLVVVGALNWLWFGLAGSELGSLLGGMDTTVARVVYVVVGLSGLWLLVSKFMMKGRGEKMMRGEM